MGKQPHNNLWAEKLLQVSMPDSGEAWTDMEVILDRKMPRRFFGDTRRWILLILLLLLLIGVCNCPGRGRLFRFHGARTTPTISATRPNVPATAGVPPAKEPPSNTPATSATPSNAPSTAATPPSASSTAATRPTPPSAPSNLATPPSSPNAPSDAGTPPTMAAREPNPVASAARRLLPGPASTTTARNTHSINSGVPAADPRSRYLKTRAKPRAGSANRNDRGANAKVGSVKPRVKGTNLKAGVTGRNPHTLAISRRPHPHSSAGGAPDRPAAFADTVQTETPNQPVAPAVLKAAPRKDTAAKKDTTRKQIKKPPPPPPEEDKKQKDHGWVIGVGLNQFFPIGGQSGSTYNSDGLTGTLSDYLPVPMIRYYLNEKLYLQLEAQLNTPQPTKKNLVFNSPLPDTATIRGNTIVSSATIQQLYYFNIPLSLHYNYRDKLNAGVGVQFSHLSNAIGNFDSTITNNNTAAVTDAKSTKSFKGDTLFRRIKTNELRFLIDVNYTYKHVVLGLRYNQALSKFIDVQLPTGGTTQARNSSLQLYLRYILWDTRKKKPPLKAP